MNNMITLLKQLERQGVRLALNEKGQLISQSSKEVVTPAIGALIKAHKDELVRCLAARAAFEAPLSLKAFRAGRSRRPSAGSGLSSSTRRPPTSTICRFTFG